MVKNLISIIIPTYNRGHLINKTLDSIIAQTYTNWECIVVDDGSYDNTDQVLLKYCKKDRDRSSSRVMIGGNKTDTLGMDVE